MKAILTFVLLATCLLGQKQEVSLADLGEQVLRAANATPDLRAEAAWILKGNAGRRMQLAEELASSPRWTSQLSALSLWAMAGSQVLVAEAVEKHGFHRHNNWLIRRRVLEGLVGGGEGIPHELVLNLLGDPNWSVRCAALALVSELKGEARSACFPILIDLVADEDPQVAHLATEDLIRFGATDPTVCSAMLGIDWQEARYEPYQKRVFFSMMDASASGLIPLRPFEEFPAVQTLYERVERVLLSEPGADRVEEVIGILRDPVERGKLGDDVAQSLLLFVAQDPGWTQTMANRSTIHPRNADLLAKLTTTGWSPSLKRGVLSGICGLEDLSRILLEEAWRQETPGMASTLDHWFLSLVKEGGTTQELHLVLKFRRHMKVPPNCELLLQGLLEGKGEVASLVTGFIWRHGSEADRLALMDVLGQMKIDLRYTWGILKYVALDPKPESMAFNLEILKDEKQQRNSRITALRALQKLNANLGLDFLLKLRPHDASSFDRELCQNLVKRGHQPTIAEVLKELKETSGKAISRDLLNVARFCVDDGGILYLQGELLKGNFSHMTLVTMLMFLRPFMAENDFRKLLNDIIQKALDQTSEKMSDSGFEGMNGNDLESVFSKFGDAIDLKILFQLVLKQDGLQTLSNLQEVARKQGQIKPFTSLLMKSWQKIDLSSGNIYAVLDFVRALIRNGHPHAKKLVLDWVASRESEWLDSGLASTAGWKGAALIDEVLTDLFVRGDEESMGSALDMIRRYERFTIRSWFQSFLQGGDGKLAEDSDPTAFLVGTLGGVGDSDRGVQRLRNVLRKIEEESKTEFNLPIRFWRHWARQVVQAPKMFQPTDLIAERVLAMGPQVFSEPRLLAALGKRGMDSWGSGDTMRVFLVGQGSTQTRRPRTAKTKRGGFKAWRLKKLRPNQVFWTTQRAELALGRKLDPQKFEFNHRHSDEEMANLVHDLYERSFPGVALQLKEKARACGRATGIWDAHEIRRLLDKQAYKEALNLAHHSWEAARVFRAFERFRTEEEFLVLEAAAFWGLGRKAEAKQRLRQAGARNVEQLPWVGPRDFPGLDESQE